MSDWGSIPHTSTDGGALAFDGVSVIRFKRQQHRFFRTRSCSRLSYLPVTNLRPNGRFFINCPHQRCGVCNIEVVVIIVQSKFISAYNS